jgi:NitT/TauT family transport system substrate-binding protein
VLEIGALALAAENSPKGAVEIDLGGVPNLWNVELSSLTIAVRAGGADGAPRKAMLADVAGNAETQLLRATVSHPDGRYLLTVVEGKYRIVARRSSGITTLADLKGKRISTYPGTSAAFYLHKMLQRSNLTEKNVTIVPLAPKASAEALVAGTVDAMAMWEPHAELAIRALGDDAITFQSRDDYREIYSLHTTEANLRNPAKRAQIVSYVRQLILACQQAAADPSHVQGLLPAMNGLSKEDIAASWHYNFVCAATPNILDVLVEEENWLALQDGRSARTREQIAKLIDTSVIEEAQRSLYAEK